MRKRKNTDEVKEKIVNAYRRGVCDKEGKTLKGSRRGMAGKGSAFRPVKTEQYLTNFDSIKWSA